MRKGKTRTYGHECKMRKGKRRTDGYERVKCGYDGQIRISLCKHFVCRVPHKYSEKDYPQFVKMCLID